MKKRHLLLYNRNKTVKDEALQIFWFEAITKESLTTLQQHEQYSLKNKQ